MRSVHSFISKVFREFINTVKSTNNQSFQVQFIRNSQIQRNVQSIVVRNKRSCRSATRNSLQNWSFNLHITSVVKEVSHGRKKLRSFHKNFFHIWVNHQVHITHSVTQFGVIKSIVYFSFFIYLWKRQWSKCFT